jgi:nucleoporin p58/p45
MTGIAATLQAQHATFISLANKTALVDAELQKIKTIYTQLWRSKTGSMRDPFNPLDSADNSDYGMSGLVVK